MDLKLFFDPVPQGLVALELADYAVRHSLYINSSQMPDIDGMDIAIVGIKDGRGSTGAAGDLDAANEIRAQFYTLSKHASSLKVVDLGNLRNGPTPEDTYDRIREVGAHLMSNQILPIFIGGGHDMDWGQYLAYESLEKLISVLFIDNKVDLDEISQSIAAKSHIQRMLRHDPNYLFNISMLGHQSYLVSEDALQLLSGLGFEALRLGKVKESIQELEPVIREADMVSIDLSALQAHYAPGATDAKVYGLSGEEACQLCWYAGLNDKLSSIGLYECDLSKESSDYKTTFVAATMIWYFIDGFYNRKGDKMFRSNDYLTYEVPLGGEPSSIKFYKSKASEKWWMEVPHPEETVGFFRSRMIPCSYSDYETALEGEVPDRWISAYSKMV